MLKQQHQTVAGLTKCSLAVGCIKLWFCDSGRSGSRAVKANAPHHLQQDFWHATHQENQFINVHAVLFSSKSMTCFSLIHYQIYNSISSADNLRRPTCECSEYKTFQHPRVQCKSECQTSTLVLLCNGAGLSNAVTAAYFIWTLKFRPILMETTLCSSHPHAIIRNCKKDPFLPEQCCLCSLLIFAPRQANISHSTLKINQQCQAQTQYLLILF